VSDFTPEELRGYPPKDRRTAEEALATIERIDGFDCIHGIPLPPCVRTRGDRVRWAHCVRLATRLFGGSIAIPYIHLTARVYYEDRETFVD
jgi:hypothetical protein